jgi:hypothetical protein
VQKEPVRKGRRAATAPVAEPVVQRHGALPACRLTTKDLAALGDLFRNLAVSTGGTGTYAFDTVWDRIECASPELLGNSETSDVVFLEWTVKWDGGQARLTIDLEPAPGRGSSVFCQDDSRLIVRGVAPVVNPFWKDAMEICERRRWLIGAFVSSHGVQALGLIVVMVSAILLPLTTLRKVHAGETVAVFTALVVGAILTLAFATVLLPLAACRVQVKAWGRLSKTRGRIAYWTATFANGLLISFLR